MAFWAFWRRRHFAGHGDELGSALDVGSTNELAVEPEDDDVEAGTGGAKPWSEAVQANGAVPLRAMSEERPIAGITRQSARPRLR